MPSYFIDTSALSKRYVTEVGTSWMIGLTHAVSGNLVLISELTIVEFCSALARRQRQKQLAMNDMLLLRTSFLLDSDEEYLTMPIDESVLIRARDLVMHHPLRTLDAIQLACAIEATITLAEPLIFIRADNILLNAAVIEGFSIDNPLAHP